jgi:hypothetical protein
LEKKKLIIQENKIDSIYMGMDFTNICDFKSWLKELNLSNFENAFIDNGYDTFEFILEAGLTEKDLEDIGLKKGHIKKVLLSIEYYKKFKN